jgi:hypothetical protein
MDKKPRGDKTSQAELEQRITTVIDWLIAGQSFSKVVAVCCREWKVCQRTAANYIAEANERIKATFQKDLEAETAKAKERLENVYCLATQSGEYAAATGAQRELIKLLGLAAPEKVQHDVTDKVAEFLKEIRAVPDETA